MPGVWRTPGLDGRSEFEDAALSGFGIDQRPGYQQLLAAALSAPATFEVILVDDRSRLTRWA